MCFIFLWNIIHETVLIFYFLIDVNEELKMLGRERQNIHRIILQRSKAKMNFRDKT